MSYTKIFWMLIHGLTATLFALLISGCAGPPKAPMTVTERNAPAPSVAPLPGAIPLASAALLSPPISPTATDVAPSVDATPVIGSAVETKSSPSPTPTKAVTPAAKPAAAPAKAAIAPTTTAATQPAKAAPTPAAKSAVPPLDMKSLETRLKQTDSIGFMTKIALKNQVNDLLEQFRAFHRGRLSMTLAELRRPFEMLLQKVLALLQDGDPPLAIEIVASREAIWGILADPAKFATI